MSWKTREQLGPMDGTERKTVGGTEDAIDMAGSFPKADSLSLTTETRSDRPDKYLPGEGAPCVLPVIPSPIIAFDLPEI